MQRRKATEAARFVWAVPGRSVDFHLDYAASIIGVSALK